MHSTLIKVVASAALIIAAALPMSAHHSFSAEYDAQKPVTFKGYVTKLEWMNPHVWFYVNVKNADGTVSNWGFEMGPPHGLQNRGWTRTTMKLGDEVIISGTAAKNGSNRVNARSVTMAATGQKLGAASSESETP